MGLCPFHFLFRNVGPYRHRVLMLISFPRPRLYRSFSPFELLVFSCHKANRLKVGTQQVLKACNQVIFSQGSVRHSRVSKIPVHVQQSKNNASGFL